MRVIFAKKIPENKAAGPKCAVQARIASWIYVRGPEKKLTMIMKCTRVKNYVLFMGENTK